MTFAEYAEKKTADALRPAIPGFVAEFDDARAGMLAIGNAWSERLFGGPFHLSPIPATPQPACSLVFVQSHDGNTGTQNPFSLGGGDTDKHLIYEGLSQVAANAVLTGADTIRGGEIVFSVWHPELVALRASLGMPRHPVQVVATLRGMDVENSLIFNVPEIPVFVLTIAAGADGMAGALATRPWVTLVVMDEPTDLPVALVELRARGIDRISCVGGRHLATQLLDARMIQDVYLTTSPKNGGEPSTPFYPKPLEMEVVVRKQGREAEAGVLFEHLASGLQPPASIS
jgi:5-amino-6-(5-phosphoribosylamino)uracil reductase